MVQKFLTKTPLNKNIDPECERLPVRCCADGIMPDPTLLYVRAIIMPDMTSSAMPGIMRRHTAPVHQRLHLHQHLHRLWTTLRHPNHSSQSNQPHNPLRHHIQPCQPKPKHPKLRQLHPQPLALPVPNLLPEQYSEKRPKRPTPAGISRRRATAPTLSEALYVPATPPPSACRPTRRYGINRSRPCLRAKTSFPPTYPHWASPAIPDRTPPHDAPYSPRWPILHPKSLYNLRHHNTKPRSYSSKSHNNNKDTNDMTDLGNNNELHPDHRRNYYSSNNTEQAEADRQRHIQAVVPYPNTPCRHMAQVLPPPVTMNGAPPLNSVNLQLKFFS